MTDNEIIELYFGRSETAITESEKKYGVYCHSIAKNILHTDQDAEDCVNDTWARAWDAVPPTRPSSLSAFFGRITRNLAFSVYRRMTAEKRGGSQTELCIDELEECIPSEMTGNISENYIIKDALDRFLEGLSEKSRKVFMRRYWYGCSINEIADFFSMSESAVKTSLMRTRNSLKVFLEKEGITI